MKEVYLLLGSNEQNRNENLEEAAKLIELYCEKIIYSSSLYETEAWGLKEQRHFLNRALMINTSISAQELLITLKKIERETGRVETIKWGPRIIDIDILFYGNEVINLPELKIPHPYLHERRFTLVPLNEIAPNLIHPVFLTEISSLLERCTDKSEISVFR